MTKLRSSFISGLCKWCTSSSTMTTGSATADQAVSSRARNSDGSRCTSVAATAAWAKAPGTARCRARTNVSQNRSGRSSPSSSVTHSRRDRVQGPEPLRDGYGLPGGGTAGHQRHPPVGLSQNLD